MNVSRRSILQIVLAVAVLAAVVVGGWAIISYRAGESGAAAIPAAVLTDLPSPVASPTSSPSPEAGRWYVAALRRKVPVYDKPSKTARIRMDLPRQTRYGSRTVCLIRKTERSGGAEWHNVWLPTGPNGARGWLAQAGIDIYRVRTQIVIDLSDRKLSVAREDDGVLRDFPVAIGEPAFPTPQGEFFITEKIQPADVKGPFGAFVMALSAYSPKLMDVPEWQGAQVAIHGTNQPQLIGQAVSHGCIRMKDPDILELNTLVKTGSPVIIRK